MSDPVLVIDHLSPPFLIPEACSQPPPARAQTDACTVKVPLMEKGKDERSRYIRMDRQGSRFVVSPDNKKENLAWMKRFKNQPDIAAYLRPMLDSEFLRIPHPPQEDRMELRLTTMLASAAWTLTLGPIGLIPALVLQKVLSNR